MRTIQESTSHDFCPTSAMEYLPLVVSSSATWGGTLAAKEQLVCDHCVLSGFEARLNGSPGTGDTLEFTLMKNGSATSVVITISGSNFFGEDALNEVECNPGDRLAWRCVPSGTPAQRRFRFSYYVDSENVQGEVFFCGSSDNLSNSAVEFNSLNGGDNWSGIAGRFSKSLVMANAGTLLSLYVRLSGSPGSGKSYKFDIFTSNSSGAQHSVTIADTDTEGSDLSTQLSMSPGDLISSIRCTPSGSPTVRDAYWSIGYREDNQFQSQICGGSDAALPATIGVSERYNYISGYSHNWIATENNRKTLVKDKYVAGLWIATSDAAGSGNNWNFKLRENNSDTGPSVTINGPTQQSGFDTTSPFYTEGPNSHHEMEVLFGGVFGPAAAWSAWTTRVRPYRYWDCGAGV